MTRALRRQRHDLDNHRVSSRRRDERGVALALALGALAVLSMLGIYYVNAMLVEDTATALEVRETRARLAADAGLQAGLGRLARALDEDQVVQLTGRTWDYTWPVYGLLQGSEMPQPRETERAETQVRVLDESAKLNVNHAPASVLQAVLGIDGAAARRITASRPDPSLPAEEQEGAWLLSLDDLVTRGLLTEEQFAALDTGLLTVDSVADHANAGAWLNINTCPPEVLAAVVDLPASEGDAVASARPFRSLAALAEAAGKAPETFNIPPSAQNPTALPTPLAYDSNAFRIVSEARVGDVGPGDALRRTARSRAEAVVLAGNDQLDVISWQR